jgi:hypothetical protein
MAAPSQAQVPPRELGPTVPVPTPSMQALGRERYRIGSIIVDRKTQRLTVSGRLLGADRPLEYFAVAKGGYKSYESLVELDATGSEFNLACILLGLDASKSKRSEFQFSKDPLSGQRVGVEVAWKVGNKRVTTTPLKMLLTDQQRQVEGRDDWVYTGSMMIEPDHIFGADSSGSIIGFVHDPTSIIEHTIGLGIGAYGSVAGNKPLLPPNDTPIELTMKVLYKGEPR